jgi:acetyl-CoA synthetase
MTPTTNATSTSTPDHATIDSILQEKRLFHPPANFSKDIGGAYVNSLQEYRDLYERSLRDPEGFWAEIARQLEWFQPWKKVLDWRVPDAKWFVGGKTNICHNCVDRQVNAGLGQQTAIVWEGEPVDVPSSVTADQHHGHEVRRLTYNDLLRETSKLANVLKNLGVRKGEVVTLYMGMVPELAIAMLACARIGAAHSVIFGGFSAAAIADRANDAKSKIIITCDGAWRRGKIIPLKENVDAACGSCHSIQHVIVVKRCHNAISWNESRDHWWHDLMTGADERCACELVDSEHMLFLLYTSGSTGKPKGIMHTTGGYMVYTYITAKYVFNLREGGRHLEAKGVGHWASGTDAPWLVPGLPFAKNRKWEPSHASPSAPGSRPAAAQPIADSEELTTHAQQLFWCTADIGWVTGHSYIVYGILPNRVPTFMYEGAPNFPQEDRFWDIIERHKITQFYTAPTAIRAFMKWGEEHARKHDLSSLKILGTVGEPINPEAWMWYHRVIGGEKCPIVDTWWQTETGGHMITPLPGATPTTPGSCTLPFFGVDAAVVNDRGQEQPANVGGLLVIRKPWPGMIRGIYGDRQRFIDTYFSRVKSEPAIAQAARSGDLPTEGSAEGSPQQVATSPGRQVAKSPYYFTGDGARRDERGYFWIMGRVDDVINVAGHRLGTMEVESALVSHEAVVEAAVVGMPHEIKGTGIAAFVTLEGSFKPSEKLKADLMNHVGKEIGAIAKPDMIRFTDALPKTRSGKIMRRLLRDIAAGADSKQDTTTLEDFSVMAKLRENEEG